MAALIGSTLGDLDGVSKLKNHFPFTPPEEKDLIEHAGRSHTHTES